MSETYKKYRIWKEKVSQLIADSKPFNEHLELKRKIYPNDEIPIVWWPEEEKTFNSNLLRLQRTLQLNNYQALYRWSCENKVEFWQTIIKELRIKFETNPETILGSQDYENPKWLSGARLNITDSIFQHPKDKIAIIQGNESGAKIKGYTYEQLGKLSSRVANGLHQRGFNQGTPCAIYMPLNFESVAIYLGIIKAGMQVVSVADSFSGEELRKRLDIVSAACTFTVDEYAYGGKKIAVYEKAKMGGVPCIVLRNNDSTVISNDDQDFDSFLGKADFNSIIQSPDSVTNILFSSGTTSTPKAIPWTQITPLKCAMDGYFHQDIHADDVVTWTTGMGWMMAPWLIYAGLINGATIALWEGSMGTNSYAHFLESARVTILGTIPSLVKSWKSTGIMEGKNLSLRLFSSTGEPSNEEDYLYLMSLMKYEAPIIEYCGGTEIGGGYITGSLLQPAAPATFNTPAMASEFVLVDENRSISENGEVFLKTPSMGLSETLLNKDHHAEYFDHILSKTHPELRKHGDAYQRYQVDGHDFYRCRGRVDDSMNLGGIKVSSIEIEEIISEHTAIKECAAVSFRKTSSGPESLGAFVVLNSKGTELNEIKKELNILLTEKLNPLFRITEIRAINELPRTASNKLIRRELKKKLESIN